MYKHHIAALAIAPDSVKQDSLKKILQGFEKELWDCSNTNEFGRILQGIGKNRPINKRITGNGTISPIRKNQVPEGRKVTYTNFICNTCLLKAETRRICMTTGGDKLNYPGYSSSSTVSILNANIHINIKISDAHRGAQYLGLNIKGLHCNANDILSVHM